LAQAILWLWSLVTSWKRSSLRCSAILHLIHHVENSIICGCCVSSEVFTEKLYWIRSQPFFQSELVVFKLAEQFVKAKGRTDHSVAELFYIDDDKGTGYADGFASHYQAELITETTNAMETFDKSHIGTLGSNMFSTYFQPDRVDGC